MNKKWSRWVSNPLPSRYQHDALPTELLDRDIISVDISFQILLFYCFAVLLFYCFTVLLFYCFVRIYKTRTKKIGPGGH